MPAEAPIGAPAERDRASTSPGTTSPTSADSTVPPAAGAPPTTPGSPPSPPPAPNTSTPSASVDTGPPPGSEIDVGVGAWILNGLPDGFIPVLVTDQWGRREVYYQQESDRNDLYDSPIVIVVELEQPPALDQRPGAEAVDVQSFPGYVYEIHGDGEHYGTAISWRDDQSRWVTIQWHEVAPFETIRELAGSAQAIGDDEWALLRRQLDPDVVIISPRDADGTPIALVDAVSSSGVPYRLVGIVPIQYPLSDIDGRPACYRLDIGDDIGPVQCDDHPWWTRVGDDTFVYGTTGPDVTAITVSHMDLTQRLLPDDEPIVIATSSPDIPSPVAFFAAEIPDWCWVHIDTVDGVEDPRLGPIGPNSASEHHAACLAE